MDRRSFLKFLGIVPVVAVAPKLLKPFGEPTDLNHWSAWGPPYPPSNVEYTRLEAAPGSPLSAFPDYLG